MYLQVVINGCSVRRLELTPELGNSRGIKLDVVKLPCKYLHAVSQKSEIRQTTFKHYEAES